MGFSNDSPLGGHATSLPAKHGVEDNAQWQQETGCFGRHAGEGRHNGRTAYHEHQGDQDVREQAKANEDAMSGPPCSIVSMQDSLKCGSPPTLSRWDTDHIARG